MEFLNSQRETIGEHWRKTKNAYESNQPQQGVFEFGELLDCYERTCFSLNRLSIGKPTYELFRDHILEVLFSISESELLWGELQALRSGPRTYREMEAFVAKNRKHLEEIGLWRSKLELLTTRPNTSA